MKDLDRLNPGVSAVYFLAVSLIAMFSLDPILLGISLLGALCYCIFIKGVSQKTHLAMLLLILIFAAVNVAVSHNGVTVLFVANDTPITLEAMIYGAIMGLSAVSVIYWFSCFSKIMTSDKLLYVLALLSPKISLIISMGLRYVPLFKDQVKKIKNSQRALGLYGDESIVGRIKGSVRVFSVMVTWALENGIITADSMSARGYGLKKRSHYSPFTFGMSDALFLAAVALLSVTTLVCMGLGAFEFEIYPKIVAARSSPLRTAGYFAYGALSFLPTIITVKEKIKWTYLKSKI